MEQVGHFPIHWRSTIISKRPLKGSFFSHPFWWSMTNVRLKSGLVLPWFARRSLEIVFSFTGTCRSQVTGQRSQVLPGHMSQVLAGTCDWNQYWILRTTFINIALSNRQHPVSLDGWGAWIKETCLFDRALGGHKLFWQSPNRGGASQMMMIWMIGFWWVRNHYTDFLSIVSILNYFQQISPNS